MSNKETFEMLLNISNPIVIFFFAAFQLTLPLWHDEIYQYWITSKDINSIITITTADPNYLLHTIIYQ